MELLPQNQPLNNIHIEKFAGKHLNRFRGVFMRDTLPHNCNNRECGVINLDSSNNVGTHWCAYYKLDGTCFYFDSFGNLPPPKEMVDYLGSKCNIFFNYHRLQEFDTIICGHLCLLFLCQLQNEIKL